MANQETPRSWVIGSGGLLGSALVKRLGSSSWSPNQPLVWPKPDFHPALSDFAHHVGNQAWAIYWAAGAATVSSSQQECSIELEAFKGFLEQVRQHLNLDQGTFALMSSAGGIYAGSREPLIHSQSAPSPETPYGHLKLAMESATRELQSSGAKVINFRITNLYGPRVNRTKAQGLIHHAVRSALTKEPLTVYVPLGTLRDYVYVHDAADVVIQRTLSPEAPSGTELLGSGLPTSVAGLVSEVQRVTHRRVPYCVSQARQGQPGSMVFSPSLRADTTPLNCGIKRTVDVLARVPR